MSNATNAAVAELLRRLPDDWADVPEDADGDALAALVAAGFAARRIHFTVKLPGCDETAIVTIEAAGEDGLAEAMTAAVQDWWARCGRRWQELRQDTGEPVRPIVNRQRDEWKLTPDGRTARADIEQGSSAPIDFALKRGFFDGRPRVLPDGRVTQRLPVRGYGRLVSLENAPSGPLSVAISNWSEGAEAFAKGFRAVQSAPLVRDGEAKQSKAETPEYAWELRGGIWHIQAFGERGDFPDAKGFRYIARLLADAGKPVPMTYLLGGKFGDITESTALDEGLRARSGGGEPLADETTLAELKKEIQDTKEELDEATKNCDATLIDVNQRKLVLLMEHYRSLVTPDGKPKTFPGERDKLRSRIYKALKRACDTIGKRGLPKTADHLKAGISAAEDGFIYKSTPPVAWTVRLQ